MKFKKVFIVFCIVLLAGCNEVTKLDLIEEPELMPVNQNPQTPIPAESDKEYEKAYDLKIRTNDLKLSKYEPETGCYAGAYILSDKIVDGDISNFEKETGKEHAIYTNNITLGGEFPEKWFLECIAQMKTPCITIDSPDWHDPYDIELLTKTAEEIGAFNLPVFVRLYPYSKGMGYTAKDYVEFYKQARGIFQELAPNAALVWSVYFEDVYDCGSFYPGDDYVDWVGISVFLDIINGGEHKDALNYINYFYYNYQKLKPVMLSELGVSHFTTEDNSYHTAQAAEEIKKLYFAVRKSYPRIKAVIYADLNLAESSKERNSNDYSIMSEDLLKNTYSASVSAAAFLSEVDPVQSNAVPITIRSPFPAYYKDEEYYIAHKTLEHDLRLQDLHLLSGKHVLIEGEKYYSMATVNSYSYIDFFVDNETDVMVIQD